MPHDLTPRLVRGVFFGLRKWVGLEAERNQMWERACSRRRCVSQLIWQLTHRIREQARSHSWPGSNLRMRSQVGAGLPAIAVGQPNHVWPDPPPSRASPLPQLIGLQPEKMWSKVGAGLPAIAVGQPTHVLPDTPPSRASRIVAPPLPQLAGFQLENAVAGGSWLACDSGGPASSCMA